VLSSACSPLKVNRCFERRCYFQLPGRIREARKQNEARSKQHLLRSSFYLAYSIPKMEAACSFETSADFWQTTVRHLLSCSAYSTIKTEAKYSSETSVDLNGVQGVISQKIYRCENLKSYITETVFEIRGSHGGVYVKPCSWVNVHRNLGRLLIACTFIIG
jgi:hypothetical protein